VTAFLIDEMFPGATAEILRKIHGHDAVHVSEIGLRATDDAELAAVARAQERAVVTENVADFASERDVVLVFVLKKNLQANPAPYLGHHWPSV
jgi:predicted nuclease of predicted toxin-antitoxin system